MNAPVPGVRFDRRGLRQRDKSGRFLSRSGRNVRWTGPLHGCHPSLATMLKADVVALLIDRQDRLAMRRLILGVTSDTKGASKTDAMRARQKALVRERLEQLERLVRLKDFERSAVVPADYASLAKKLSELTGAPCVRTTLYNSPYREVVKTLSPAEPVRAARIRALMRLPRQELLIQLSEATLSLSECQSTLDTAVAGMEIEDWDAVPLFDPDNDYQWPIRRP